jgi:hypothetical protein
VPIELWGVGDIAALLGVSVTRADQLTRRAGFPDPFATMSGKRAWKRKHVEKWARANGRID